MNNKQKTLYTHHPLNQGLKLCNLKCFGLFGRLYTHHPLNQGLKLRRDCEIDDRTIALYPSSIKPRIET